MDEPGPRLDRQKEEYSLLREYGTLTTQGLGNTTHYSESMEYLLLKEYTLLTTQEMRENHYSQNTYYFREYSQSSGNREY